MTNSALQRFRTLFGSCYGSQKMAPKTHSVSQLAYTNATQRSLSLSSNSTANTLSLEKYIRKITVFPSSSVEWGRCMASSTNVTLFLSLKYGRVARIGNRLRILGRIATWMPSTCCAAISGNDARITLYHVPLGKMVLSCLSIYLLSRMQQQISFYH